MSGRGLEGPSWRSATAASCRLVYHDSTDILTASAIFVSSTPSQRLHYTHMTLHPVRLQSCGAAAAWFTLLLQDLFLQSFYRLR